MPEDLVIIGAGGFGREVADVVDAINRVETTWNLLGFLDDAANPDAAHKVERRGSRVIGPVAAAAGLPPATRFVIAIGSPAVRRDLLALEVLGHLAAATLVHPTANIGAGTTIGVGTIVCGHVDIGSDVVIGEHVHVDRAVQVGHDSLIGDQVTLHPSAVVSGECAVDGGAELGTRSTLLPRTRVGKGALVGAAACVTRDVRSGETVKGVPAR